MRELRELVDGVEKELKSMSFVNDLDAGDGSATLVDSEHLEEADRESDDTRFYVDAVDAVRRKISQVRLVWADAVHRCTTDG
jgi:hypothetical protein